MGTPHGHTGQDYLVKDSAGHFRRLGCNILGTLRASHIRVTRAFGSAGHHPSSEDCRKAFVAFWQVVLGQTTENFRRYPNPSFRQLSFSLLYTDKDDGAPRTLDLTAHDSQTFELWVHGLQVGRLFTMLDTLGRRSCSLHGLLCFCAELHQGSRTGRRSVAAESQHI